MKLNSAWGLALVVVGLVALIAAPLSAYLLIALAIIAIVAGGIITMKYYILSDKDNEKGKK